jgi:hypothetical protein
MTLPAFASLDAVPEQFRPFYREDAGQFVADLVPGAEVVGLKRKVTDLLDEKKSLASRFDGVDPEEYKALKASGGKAKDLDERLKAAATEKAALEAQLADVRGKFKGNTKKAEITRALAAENANIDLLEPLVSQLVDVDDDGHVVVRTADGGVRYKDGAGNRFTVSDLLSEMKSKLAYQPAFNVKIGSGGGATQGGTPQAIRLIDPSDKKAALANIDAIASGKIKFAG